MRILMPVVAAFVMLFTQGCKSTGSDCVAISPDGRIELAFALTAEGIPSYCVTFDGDTVVCPSLLGLEAGGGENFRSGFSLASAPVMESVDSVWTPVWGENDSIVNRYQSLKVALEKKNEAGLTRRLDICFRVYDSGIAFRYIIPAQDGLDSLVITDEYSEFAMPADLTAWWIPGDYDTQEYEYNKSTLSEIRAINEANGKIGNVSQTAFSPTGVQTSLMLKGSDSLYMNIHEAALIDYPAMHLDLDDASLTFRSWLTPLPDGTKAVVKLPFRTPWRVVMIGDEAIDILATDIIYNLNDPSKIEDTSWIKPVKYMGVWWEMITGKSQWSYTDAHDFDLATFDYSKARPHGHHGANTANVKRYIDFAADNGFDQLLVEGWNTGWEDWFGKEKDFVFDFVTPYPDFDLRELNDYAHSKGIRLMMHHETSGSIPNYERWIDTAYTLMNDYGYTAVKSGYVGNILPKGENHYNQNSVRHYLRAIQKAADHQIMVNAHEAVRPTGLARTYPNLVGNESALGTEYRNMSTAHETILPFTRLKGGPMDFTPGIFRTDIGSFVPGSNEHKLATTANQLGVYLTMYSPLQMAADLPDHYMEKADAFQFIKDVPVDWSKSIYLGAEPGEYIVVARRDKNSPDWYVGGVANEPTDFTVDFSFLPKGTTYQATIYADAPDADAVTNPEAYAISSMEVTSATRLPIHMAHGGGFAISLKDPTLK
ncbi:MAG: glycoside hydrolase family 97 protein [Pseudoflavonifractor sp.]|nr:glycoside hydrolase family 97 protein [Alloprevotella sp.]MCM1117530.1 glycoside hydrolase family 97 protein [Pseudoflavonifractor sp.]